MDDVCPGTGERESNHLNGRLSELEASQCLPRSKRLQQRLHRGIALRFKASHERDQTSAHLSQNSACLAQAGGDGQADMIGHGACLGRRVFSVKLGLRERGAERVFSETDAKLMANDVMVYVREKGEVAPEIDGRMNTGG